MLLPHSAKKVRCLLLFFVVLMLGGCGQKGDLYLPDQSRLEQDAPTRTA